MSISTSSIRVGRGVRCTPSTYDPGVPDGPPLESLTAETFQPLVNERFRVVPEGSPPFEVELAEVVAGGAHGPSREQFSLTFRGGPEAPLPQGVYRLEHAKLGALELFLVPIAPATYEAVFT